MVYIVIGALIIGLLLGLMGSGGSILTLPVLVYLLGHQDKIAVAESLAIVGGIAAVAVIPYARERLVDWRCVLFFGLPGMLGTFLGAWLSKFVPGTFQLVLFGLLMLAAAVMMLRPSKTRTNTGKTRTDTGKTQTDTGETGAGRRAVWLIGAEGLAVGVITGLVGVGGGFLIVPSLVLLANLPMRVAVGTSLAVISLNSFSGFFKYLDVLDGLDLSVNWATVAAFIAIGVAGSVTGHLIGSRINQQALRKAFAVFLVMMGLFVLGKEAPKVLVAAPASTDGQRIETQAAIEQPFSTYTLLPHESALPHE